MKVKIKNGKVIVSEHSHQVALFKWAAMAESVYPYLSCLYAIPNGGKRNAITGAMLKSEGVKSGVPDICLPVGRGGFLGMYIEMKRVDRETSKNQKEWLNKLVEYGHKCVVCYSFESAKEELEKYCSMGPTIPANRRV